MLNLVALGLGAFAVGLAPFVPTWLLAILLGAVALAVALTVRWRGLTCLAAGVAWGLVVTPAPPDLSEGEADVEATVFDVSCEHPPRCRLTLVDATAVPVDRARAALDLPRVTASFAWLDEPAVPGTVVRFRGHLRAPREPQNPTPFAAFARPRVWIEGVTTPALQEASPRWSTAVAVATRARIAFDDPDATALYRAIVLGDRADLDPALRWRFQDTGTAHLLAISGLHLALIGFGLRGLLLALLLRVPRLAQAGRPAAVAAAVALPLLWAYTEVIAPSDATRRAFVFLAIFFAGEVLARRASGRRALLIAAVSAVLVDPSAPLRAGFQLSFAAAGSLVLGLPLGRRILAFWREPGRVERPWLRRALEALSAMVLVDVLTFIATAPLTAAWFAQVPPHGLWMNLIAVPLMALVVLPVGFVWAVLAVALPPVADALAPLPELVGGLFTELVGLGANLAGPSTVAAWPIALGVLGAAAFLLLLAGGRARLVGAVALAATAVAGVTSAGPDRGDLVVTALDVGHGDAILVTPPEGGAMLVDAGGTWRDDANARLVDRAIVPSLTALGVTALDVLVITHADRDHIGGAHAVVERMAVAELWLPPCALERRTGRDLAASVLARGGRVTLLHRHPTVTWRGAELDVLWPAEDVLTWEGACRIGANDASVTMRLAFAGRAVLLTGDIEAEGEARLVAERRDRLAADVLKAAHHGSKSSSTPAFLDAVDPALVIVSGLPGRAPMPPHDAVLDDFARRGYAVHVTGRDGAVSVRVRADGTLVVDAVGAAHRSPLLAADGGGGVFEGEVPRRPAPTRLATEVRPP